MRTLHELGRQAALAVLCAATASPQALIRGVVETIEDEQRVGVREAVVRAWVDSDAVAVAHSDREGRYAIEVPAELFELGVDRPGYVAARAGGLDRPRLRRNCPADGDCGEVDFLLERTAAVEVWLLDPSGDPFADANVKLTRLETRNEEVQDGRADDRGVARFHGFAPGRYRVDVPYRAPSPQLNRVYRFEPVEAELRSGENGALHLNAQRGGFESFSLSGLIEGVDFSDGEYVLTVRDLAGQHGASARQSGPKLELPSLPKGDYVLQLWRADRRRASPIMLGRVQLEQDAGGLILTPIAAPMLAGEASFEEGAPEVARLVLRSGEGWIWQRFAVSRKSPRFSSMSPPPGVYVIEYQGDDGFLLEEPRLQLVAGARERVELVVSARFARVYGVLRGAKAARAVLSGPTAEEATTTGPDGRFAFEGLVPGQYTLCAAVAGEPCAPGSERAFAIEPGDEIELDLRVR